jgi:hypothetical protein
MAGDIGVVYTRGGSGSGTRKGEPTMGSWKRARRSMAAVALLVTNVGLVQLAGQPAQAATVTSSVLTEGFDGVTPPAVPSGWNAIRAEGRSADQTWRTSIPGFTTDPNKASIRSYGHVTDMILESPAFLAGAATKLRFYKQGIMQATAASGDNVDGVVLEIKIGSAGYVDFLAAGGTFNAGEGYNRRIASTQDNPLGGRMGWSGHQLGSSVTNATFPTSATGQTVRLRWRLGTSDHTANQGGLNFFQDQAFAIDSVQVTSEKTTQTITLTSVGPLRPPVGTTYTPTATASSGLPVTISIAPGSSSVCSISAGVITYNAPGTCEVHYTQGGDAVFAPAPLQRDFFAVMSAGEDQTISFTSTAPVNPPVGAKYMPTATATSGLDVVFSIAAGSSSVCSLQEFFEGTQITFTAVGSCVIQADQLGRSEIWKAAPQVTQTVNVVNAGPSLQTISFTSTAPVNPPVGATYTPTATATSGLPVTFSIASGSTSVCSIGAANLVNLNAVGSCVIQADQAGSPDVFGAPQVTQTVNVVAAPKASQTISFTSTAPSSPPVGATYTPTATASSGLPVAFSIASGSSSVCSLGAANLVTFNAAGSCVIQADQAGDAGFATALRVTQTVTVVKADQSINFPLPGSGTVGDAPFAVSATASSGLPVSFSVPSGGPCTISGTTVTISGPGTCSITADQAGDGAYNAAPAVTNNVTIAKASPTILGLASAGGPVGTLVHDHATVAGGASPTGNVTFRLFADNACNIEVFTSTNDLVGGTATSGSFPPAAPGTYYWTALYNGDANNNTTTLVCNAPNQAVTITKASPVMSSQASAGGLPGTPVRDVATLSGGSVPTGTVTFRLFSDNTCSTQVFTSTNALSGLTATSNWFTPATAGTYWWTALYNGDADNNTASSACQAPNQSVVITLFLAPVYTRSVTGDLMGPVTVNAGDSVLITGARVVGPVTVNPGGALTVVNSSITRGIVANAPGYFSLCGSAISGPSPAPALNVSSAPVPIRIGDPATGCARNRFAGQVSLTSNLAVIFGANEVSHNATIDTNGPGNTIVKANTVFGTLACTGNTPAPTNDGQPNTAGSKVGQCASL